LSGCTARIRSGYAARTCSSVRSGE
jgi:hypothetical protein